MRSILLESSGTAAGAPDGLAGGTADDAARQCYDYTAPALEPLPFPVVTDDGVLYGFQVPVRG